MKIFYKIFFILFISNSIYSQSLTMEDYFMLLPINIITNAIATNVDYNILENRKKLLNCEGMGKISVILDNKNYFLKIIQKFDSDHGDSVINAFIIAIFKSKSNNDIIAINNTNINNDLDISIYKTTFYKIENGQWVIINDKIIKNINFNLFFENRTDIDKQYEILDLDFILPREGTDVIVISKPAKRGGNLDEYTTNNRIFDFNYDYYKNIFKKMKYAAVELKWNWEEANFIVNKKILNTNENKLKYEKLSYNYYNN